MSFLHSHEILTRDTEAVDVAVATLAPAFEHDPVVTYMINNLTPESKRIAYIPSLFTSFLTASTLNNGFILSTPDNSACVVVLPPGEDPANPLTWYQSGVLGLIWTVGWSGIQRIIGEYAGQAEAAKSRAMDKDGSKTGKKERYYYVFIIGAKTESRGQGLGTVLMDEVKRICREDVVDGVAASCWLEATTGGSRRLYERLGWKLTEEITLGKGSVGSDGLSKEDGEGAKCWGMLYRPSEEQAVVVEHAGEDIKKAEIAAEL